MMTGRRGERPEGLLAALARSAAGHDHLCPRQVLGARIGLEAGRLFGLPLPQTQKRLVAFVESDGCFADGVAAATGCRFGRRTLRLVDYGKVAATIVDTQTEQAIRLWPHPEARRRALAAEADQCDSWQAQLVGYQYLPTSELLCRQYVTLIDSLRALIGRPGQRVVCGGCGEEVMNGRELWRDGQPFCQGCRDHRYYCVHHDGAAGLALEPPDGQVAGRAPAQTTGHVVRPAGPG